MEVGIKNFINPTSLILGLFSVMISTCPFRTASRQLGDRHHFVRTRGTSFVVDGETVFLNGFNAYWMMEYASNPLTRRNVTAALVSASWAGMNVARTWAFHDGDGNPLQRGPGLYNEDVFKALDFVISEAKMFGLRLILSLVNNFSDYGGRAKYVKWAKEHGENVTHEDEFYTNPLVKQFYKNHVKAVITRFNSRTGLTYRDDPTIFAWELMNEPRCNSTEPSDHRVHEWIKEMAEYVKSIDRNHLLEIGLEGFYGEAMPERKEENPDKIDFPCGTDFIANNQIPQIDFTTIHIYPDIWIPKNRSSEQIQIAFFKKWIKIHDQDSGSVLKKPMVIGEFGFSRREPWFTLDKRDTYMETVVYKAVYDSATSGGACGGAIVWQVMTTGMENMGDGYEIILEEEHSTAKVVEQQWDKLDSVSYIISTTNEYINTFLFFWTSIANHF